MRKSDAEGVPPLETGSGATNAMLAALGLLARFRSGAVRLQLHALAYNLANFVRTLALPEAIAHWSLTSLREKLAKIGSKIVTDARYVTFQIAEIAVPRFMFQYILRLIDGLRSRPVARC